MDNYGQLGICGPIIVVFAIFPNLFINGPLGLVYQHCGWHIVDCKSYWAWLIGLSANNVFGHHHYFMGISLLILWFFTCPNIRLMIRVLQNGWVPLDVGKYGHESKNSWNFLMVMLIDSTHILTFYLFKFVSMLQILCYILSIDRSSEKRTN